MPTQSTPGVGLLALILLSTPFAAQRTREARRALPLDVSVVEITGNPTMLFATGASVANLRGDPLVAGFTNWDNGGGGFFLETRVGYLWGEGSGTQVFEVPPEIYFNDNVQFPLAIADDGTTVGWNVFSRTLEQLPFRWTRAAGYEFLPRPGAGWNGQAVAVSGDGNTIAGWLGFGLSGLPQAVRWADGGLEFLDTAAYSRAFESSRSGRVIVGEAGPDLATPSAARWIDGVPAGLDPVPGQSTSTARVVSEDGNVAWGWAEVAGRQDLVRWAADGSARSFTPPNGLSVVAIHATNRRGSAVVGALDTLPIPPVLLANDQVPFVWRAGKGFSLIGELGLAADYDLSRAVDVSDDGKRVVGELRSSVVSQGFPPQTAFLWTRPGGTQPLDELLVSSGEPARGLYGVTAISGDGSRIVATGVVVPTPRDTPSVLLVIEPRTVDLALR